MAEIDLHRMKKPAWALSPSIVSASAPGRVSMAMPPAPATMPQLEALLRGVFEKRRFLDLIRHFIVFDDRDGQMVKKMAGYHQFHAVQRALAAIRKASAPAGDRRCGVVWHTQGSGKSLTMAFYAGRVILEPVMSTPAIPLWSIIRSGSRTGRTTPSP